MGGVLFRAAVWLRGRRKAAVATLGAAATAVVTLGLDQRYHWAATLVAVATLAGVYGVRNGPPPVPTPAGSSAAASGFDPAAAMLKYFAAEHLPVPLREVSEPHGRLAAQLVSHLPAGPEKTAAVRKLLEAKDCAVRAALP